LARAAINVQDRPFDDCTSDEVPPSRRVLRTVTPFPLRTVTSESQIE